MFSWLTGAPDAAAGQQQYQRNTYKKKNKNSFTKKSFVTLLLVSQNPLYDTKVEKVCFIISNILLK
jgi:hypothetical protein